MKKLGRKIPGPLLLISVLLSQIVLPPLAHAGNTFKYRDADGVMVFSDVRAGSAGQRQYKPFENTARTAAKVSCSGQIEERLTDPATNIQARINYFSNKHGIDPNLVKAVARVESCFDTHAVSTAGAKGLMQLMPDTAREYGANSDLFNVDINLETGIRYLVALLKQFKQNKELALAAYNAGPGSVTHYQGIPPYPETQAYVTKVLQMYQQYRDSAKVQSAQIR